MGLQMGLSCKIQSELSSQCSNCSVFFDKTLQKFFEWCKLKIALVYSTKEQNMNGGLVCNCLGRTRSKMKLGKIKEVDIRSAWPHEQYDFSKWLAEEENIRALGEEMNLSLTDADTERFVGSYRCDIICKDELTGKSVLIENQLEQTNHDHLGKIITYASGLDASVVVWIVAKARDEHASAIEWLNKHTDDDLSFFVFDIDCTFFAGG